MKQVLLNLHELYHGDINQIKNIDKILDHVDNKTVLYGFDGNYYFKINLKGCCTMYVDFNDDLVNYTIKNQRMLLLQLNNQVFDINTFIKYYNEYLHG